MSIHHVVKHANGSLYIGKSNELIPPGHKIISYHESWIDANSALNKIHAQSFANVPAPKVKSYYQDGFGVIYPFNKIVYVASNTEVVFSNDIRRMPGDAAAFEEAYLLWLDAQ